MKLSERLPSLIVISVIVVGIGVFVSRLSTSDGNNVTVDVKIPDLSSEALLGKVAFDANCARCHGENGSGSKNGPPLVYDTYNPGHHSDEAFFLAAKLGVRRHHWNFGNMPPRPEVTKSEIASIVRYIRELQEANGIFFKKHRM